MKIFLKLSGMAFARKIAGYCMAKVDTLLINLIKMAPTLQISRFLSICLAHTTLCLFVIILFIPLYLAFVASSHDLTALVQMPLPILPGKQFGNNLQQVLFAGFASTDGLAVWKMLINSLLMASIIAIGKIILAIFSAFALIFCDFPLKKTAFALIFATLMLPVEVRIVPTFQVIAAFGWLNTYAGLTLPLMASATATFLFRQFFKTVPRELVDAAKLDGAGPIRFFIDILLPLSKTHIAALFIILFVYGWNQYLWPLIVTSDSDMSTIVMGIRHLAGVADQMPQWHYIMTIALIALSPPCMVIVIMQSLFEKGLMQ